MEGGGWIASLPVIPIPHPLTPIPQLSQPLQEACDKCLAAKEVGGVGLAEGAQPFIGIFQIWQVEQRGCLLVRATYQLAIAYIGAARKCVLSDGRAQFRY